MKKLIAGNWKMNTSSVQAEELVRSISLGISTTPDIMQTCEFVVFPPYVHLETVGRTITQTGGTISLGAQDCSIFEDFGAYTGDISASMLKDYGCKYVILGHSERRQYACETNEIIEKKAHIAHKKGLITIICVGETQEQREQGHEKSIVNDQLLQSLPKSSRPDNTIIAYEPVWAIGTGKTATTQDVEDMHNYIRKKLEENLANPKNLRILYGGSMKPENAKDLLLLNNVNGGLIGGASLKADQFLAIGRAAPRI